VAHGRSTLMAASLHGTDRCGVTPSARRREPSSGQQRHRQRDATGVAMLGEAQVDGVQWSPQRRHAASRNSRFGVCMKSALAAASGHWRRSGARCWHRPVRRCARNACCGQVGQLSGARPIHTSGPERAFWGACRCVRACHGLQYGAWSRFGETSVVVGVDHWPTISRLANR
jgi:hypothetical protein